MLMLVLVELSARDDHAFPSLRWLAQHLGCSEACVRNAIREAERHGLLRRSARFDHHTFAGGRQTSNRYEILSGPSVSESPTKREPQAAPVTPIPIARSVAPRGAPAPVADHEALPTALRSARPRSLVLDTPPLLPAVAPPSPPAQGLKDLRENKQEKASSTDAPTVPAPMAVPSCSAEAAALFQPILQSELKQEFQRRFTAQGFGGLLLAIQRNDCQNHPKVAKHALERLRAASHVLNPGGYFTHVFKHELQAAALAGPDTPQVAEHDARIEHRQRLVERARQLRAQLERVQCLDFEAADRIRAELEPIYAELRAQEHTAAAAIPKPEPTPVTTEPPRPRPRVRAEATPLPAELARVIAEAQKAQELRHQKALADASHAA